MFNVINAENASTMRAAISRGEKTLTFHIGYYGIKSFKDREALPVFYFLNSYLSQCTDEFREDVFNHYLEIIRILDEYWQIDILTSKLKEQCVSLLNLFNVDDLIHWVKNNPEIVVPDNISKEFDERIIRDNLGSRDQTYIKKDYQELVAVAIITKLMIPVWGEYIDRRGSEFGTKFKEFYSFKLISNADFIKSEGFKKLTRYVYIAVKNQIEPKSLRKNSNPKSLTAPKILSGISTDDLPMWTLSNVVVRRLPVANLLGTSSHTNLITNISGFTNQKLNNNTTLQNRLTDKEVRETSGDEDDKISVLENYKISVEHPPGTIIEFNSYTSEEYLDDIIHKLLINYDKTLIKTAFKTSKAMLPHPIGKPQIMLIKWIMKPVINPRAIDYLKKTTIVNLAAITQVVLWELGHKYLSLVSTAIPVISNGEVPVDTFVSRARIPRVLKAELNEAFPYQGIIRGFKREGSFINPVLETIETFVNELSSNIWEFTASDKQVEQAIKILNRRPPLPPDIKIRLGELILDLGQRKMIKKEEAS
jgi:hypothetical protein